ncbi:MAG: hypothetical protein ACREQ2_24405 [Candidatus Binatia bacterium]
MEAFPPPTTPIFEGGTKNTKFNVSPLGEVKVRHAGERRHPGSFSVQVLKTAWIPASAGTTGLRVNFQSTNSEPLGLELRVAHLNFFSALFTRLLFSRPEAITIAIGGPSARLRNRFND